MDYKTFKYRGPVSLCPLCSQPMSMNACQQGGLHITCFDQDILVYKWRMPGCCWIVQLEDEFKDSFFGDLKNQAEDGDYDELFEVKVSTMKAGEYYNLPDFQGF